MTFMPATLGRSDDLRSHRASRSDYCLLMLTRLAVCKFAPFNMCWQPSTQSDSASPGCVTFSQACQLQTTCCMHQ